MGNEDPKCLFCHLNGWPEPKPVVFDVDSGMRFCVFHAPATLKRKALGSEELLSDDEFNHLVFERIEETVCHECQTGVGTWCELSGTIFPSHMDFRLYQTGTPLPTINFWDADFTKGADFTGVEFSSHVQMGKAKFRGPTDLRGTIFRIGPVDMRDLTSASLENLIFTRSELPSLTFNECTWPRRLGLEVHGQGSLTECEELYRAMKQRAAAEHDQPMVSCWHYREKLMGLKKLLGEKSWEAQALLKTVEDDTATLRQRFASWRRLFATIPWTVRRSVLFWYWTLSGFDERPRRAGWSLFALAALSLPLFLALKLVETHPWQVPLRPDFPAMLAAVGEWLRCMPLVKLEYKPDPDLPFIGPVRFILNWAFQTLITLQATLFDFTLRNQYRR